MPTPPRYRGRVCAKTHKLLIINNLHLYLSTKICLLAVELFPI